MSVVLRAQDTRLPRTVALKLIRQDRLADQHYLARFDQEVKSIARLEHSNIVRVHEIGRHLGRPFLALEFVDGGSFADQLHGSPVPARLSAKIICTLALALDYAHRQGVVHRDLKPANVLLSRSTTLVQSEDSPEIGLDKRLSEDPRLEDFEPKIADFDWPNILTSRD